MSGPMRKNALAVLCAGLAAALLSGTWALRSARAAGGAFPYALEPVTLKNGLRVVLVPMQSPGLTAYYTAVRTGARNEVEVGHTGFAHFFEHMMFRGTKKNPSFDTKMAEFGWHNNAFTSDDQTIYTDFGPADRLGDVIALEADRFQFLDYDEAGFRTEALAVLGEYNKSAAAPWMRLEETLASTAFTQHTYRHTTMGFLADIKAMPGKFAYSKQFHRRFYRPDNCVVVVTGDFDKDAVLKRIEGEFGGWSGKADLPKVPVEPPQRTERRAEVRWPSETLPRLIFAYKVPPASDRPATAASEVIYAYLFGETGLLHKSLVLERQIAEPFDAWSQPHRDPGVWSFVATAKSPEVLPEIEKAVEAAIDDLRHGKIDPEQLKRIQSNRRYALLLGLDDPEKVAETLAWQISVTGDVDAIDRSMAALDALTPADITAFAQQRLVPAGRTLVTLIHAPAGEKGAGK